MTLKSQNALAVTNFNVLGRNVWLMSNPLTYLLVLGQARSPYITFVFFVYSFIIQPKLNGSWIWLTNDISVSVQIMSELKETVRELRDHTNLLQQWSMLVMPSYSGAGSDLEYKTVVSVLAECFSKRSDRWLTNLTSYHSDRAQYVFEVRRFNGFATVPPKFSSFITIRIIL